MKTNDQIQVLINECNGGMVLFLEKMGALYILPLRSGTEPVGPLVGRKSTYIDPITKKQLSYVSENYFYGPALYPYPLAIKHIAQELIGKIKKNYGMFGVVIRGIGLGGELLANSISEISAVDPSDVDQNRVVLVQDILDIEPLGVAIAQAKVEGKKIAYVCCLIDPYDGCFDKTLPMNSQGPVLLVSLIKQKLTKYQQDHPLVAEAVAKGDVVWDPKNEWWKLAKIIDEANAIDSSRIVPAS